MKNKSSNKISSLSREDIQNYQTSQDPKVKHAIEEKSLMNDFDTDALEGWSSSTTTMNSLKKLDRKYLTVKKWYYYSALMMIIIVALFIVYPTDQNDQKNEVVTDSKLSKIEHTDVFIPTSIQEMKEIPEHKQIQPKTIRSDFEKKENIELTKQTENSNESEAIDEIPIKKYEKTELIVELQKKQLNAKEIYLHDLKLVDYRAYRSKPAIPTKQMIITGTPANKEAENSITEEANDWKTIDIPYIEYIDKTMAIFGKGNYKKALTRLEVILKTYPDDVNANFYAGLCYYNLKESVKAIEAFENCLSNEYINFSEEAEWYLYKSLIQNDNNEKARELKEKIKKKGGYYSQFN